MRFVLALLLTLAAAPALAVQPDEMLDDPALETRARELSRELRCLVCQNESIDDSNADLARDLRILVRERILAGDTDEEVRDFLVERYGEFVLLKPRFEGMTLVLWLSGPILLIVGGVVAVLFLRRRERRAERSDAPLTSDERAALERALRER